MGGGSCLGHRGGGSRPSPLRGSHIPVSHLREACSPHPPSASGDRQAEPSGAAERETHPLIRTRPCRATHSHTPPPQGPGSGSASPGGRGREADTARPRPEAHSPGRAPGLGLSPAGDSETQPRSTVFLPREKPSRTFLLVLPRRGGVCVRACGVCTCVVCVCVVRALSESALRWSVPRVGGLPAFCSIWGSHAPRAPGLKIANGQHVFLDPLPPARLPCSRRPPFRGAGVPRPVP